MRVRKRRRFHDLAIRQREQVHNCFQGFGFPRPQRFARASAEIRLAAGSQLQGSRSSELIAFGGTDDQTVRRRRPGIVFRAWDSAEASEERKARLTGTGSFPSTVHVSAHTSGTTSLGNWRSSASTFCRAALIGFSTSTGISPGSEGLLGATGTSLSFGRSPAKEKKGAIARALLEQLRSFAPLDGSETRLYMS